MTGSHRVAHLPGCSEGIGSLKRSPRKWTPDVFGQPGCFGSCSGPCFGPGLCLGPAAAAAAALPAAASCGVTLSPRTSWWSRSRNAGQIFVGLLDENVCPDVELTQGAPQSQEAWTLPAEALACSAQQWQFFQGDVHQLQAPPGFAWLVVPFVLPSVPAFSLAPVSLTPTEAAPAVPG